MRTFFVLSLAATACAKLVLNNKAEVPGGKVYISDNEIYGTGAPSGSGAEQGVCNNVPKGMQTSKSEPRVKVCGSTVKAIVYLLNDCDDSYHTQEVGKCDTSLPATTCEEIAPGTDGANPGLMHYQSFQIVPCGAAKEE